MESYVVREKLEKLFAQEAIRVDGHERIPWIKAIWLLRNCAEADALAHWIYIQTSNSCTKPAWECSKCNSVSDYNSLFCPVCGRKMW